MEGNSLRNEIANLQAILQGLDSEIEAQNEAHQKISIEKSQMEMKAKEVKEQLQMTEAMIIQKKLAQNKAAFKDSLLVDDLIIEVERVDQLGWRKKSCMDSDDESESEDSDFTESQPQQSLKPASPLD